MNRAERRKMMKTVPEYKKALKSATEKAVDNLEMMFKQNWEKDSETLNDEEGNYDNDEKDNIYND